MKKQMNVKNVISVLGLIPILFGLGILSSCLDSVNFDPNDFEVKVDITGEISTTDITSAVLMITNRSKTVDVVNVVITQPEWLPTEENPNAMAPSISFKNKPKRLERKAQYLAPSDKSYQVDFTYKFDAYGNIPAGDGNKTLIVPLPIPKEIVEIFIYRDKDGNVFIDTVVDDFDPADIGNPPTDPSLGEGSVPAEIPPENRNKMGTFVVINRTNSQIIGSVNFVKGNADYTMYNVNVNDKQSIALGQGGWTTSLKYTRSNNEKTLGPVNSIIVPSNDPQTTKEHYLYFYKNKRGEYAISQEWPPFPNDVDEEDILPPDVGYGRGVIKIINESYATANKVIITNMQNAIYAPLDIGYRNFIPSIPVQYDKTGYVNVIGNSSFPIDNHENYLIMVNLQLSDGSDGTVMRKAYLKDQVVTIVITRNDIITPTTPPTNPENGNYWKETPKNIWWLYDKNNILVLGPLWGGYDGKPGGGDDIFAVEFNNGAKSYWISCGQNIWQEVEEENPYELGVLTGGGGMTTKQKGNPAITRENARPVYEHINDIYYLGPLIDTDGDVYYIGDKSNGDGYVNSVSGLWNIDSDDTVHSTDQKWYLIGGVMVPNKPGKIPIIDKEVGEEFPDDKGIVWIVIAKEGDFKLIITKNTYGRSPYNTSNLYTLFEDSTMYTAMQNWFNSQAGGNIKALALDYAYQDANGQPVAKGTIGAGIEYDWNGSFPSKSEWFHTMGAANSRHANERRAWTKPGDLSTKGNGQVFALSISEANKYFQSTGNISKPGENNKGRRATGVAPFYWLRSPGNVSNVSSEIYESGEVEDYHPNYQKGFRATVWIKYQ